MKQHHLNENVQVRLFHFLNYGLHDGLGLFMARPICAVRKICASLPEFDNFTGCSKNGPRDFQIYEEYVFYQVRKLIFQIVSFCKTSILIATQKTHHVPANINVFEIQRKAKYHPCSLKFNLPICAVRKICASLPEFENFTGCSKNGARDLQIFEEYVFYQVRKMVTGLQRKW